MDGVVATVWTFALLVGLPAVVAGGIGYAGFCLVRHRPAAPRVTVARVGAALAGAGLAGVYQWAAVNLYVEEDWIDSRCPPLAGTTVTDGVPHALPLGLSCRNGTGLAPAAIPSWVNPTLLALAVLTSVCVTAAIAGQRATRTSTTACAPDATTAAR